MNFLNLFKIKIVLTCDVCSLVRDKGDLKGLSDISKLGWGDYVLYFVMLLHFMKVTFVKV